MKRKVLLGALLAGVIVSTPSSRASAQTPPAPHKEAPKEAAKEESGRKSVVEPSWWSKFFGTQTVSQNVVYTPTAAGLKWMPDLVPSKITLSGPIEPPRGSFVFASQPVVLANDVSFRPLAKKEPKEVKFILSNPELPMKLPASLSKVSLETQGNYLALPAHAIYPLFGFAVKKKDTELANALEQVLGKIKPKGVAVYTWTDKKVELILYDEPTSGPAQYRGTVTLTENVPDLRDRINSLIVGLYSASLAKFSTSETEREQLKTLASAFLPRDAVEQYVQSK